MFKSSPLSRGTLLSTLLILMMGLGLLMMLQPDFSNQMVLVEQEMENEEDEAANIEHYFQYRSDQLKNKKGKIPAKGLLKAIAKREAMLAAQARRPEIAGIDNVSWTEAGPKNVGGRIRSILPVNSSTVFIGSVSGGLWKTTNCCSTSTTWSPINDWIANLGISTLIMDPTNPSVMYAGTGETSGTSFRGVGAFKSTDGGNTWNQLASTNNSNWYFVNRLAISPNGANLLAATGTGLYHSTDGGASWAQRLTTTWRDVKFDPTNSNNAVAGAVGYAWYTTNGGAAGSWAAATFAPAISGRVELAYAPSDPSIVYASVNQNNGDVYKSTDGGHSFTRVNTGQSLLSSQGDYDNTIWVKPDDPNFVVVAGVDMYKSTDGGATFTKIAYWGYSWHYREPPSPHADHHALVSIPGSNLALLNGNDGGIYYTADVTTAGTNADYNLGWVYLNNNLGITQFYGIAGNSNGVIIGGSQDNGATVYNPASGVNAWTFFSGGDGGKAAADPTDPNYLYNEYIFGKIYRSSTGGVGDAQPIFGTYHNGTNWVCRAAPYRIDDACNQVGSFVAPILLDPNDSNRLFVGGLSLWVSNDVKTPYVSSSPTGGPQWAAIKSSVGSGINAIAVAPSNSDVIWVGHNNSHIYMTTNGTNASPTWTRVDTNFGANYPGTRPGSIAIDKNDSNIVMVGFWGYGAHRVWRTTDGGSTWNSITNNLPQTPVYAVAINPENSAWLYVGTEIGVFASIDTGANWNVPGGDMNGDGPANVAVFDLQWMGGGNSTGSPTLIAGTHGRGAWTADVTPPSNTNTYADDDSVCGGNSPCYATISGALSNVRSGGTVTVYAGTYSESVVVNRNVTVNIVGNITVNNISQYTGTTWNSGGNTIAANDVKVFGGTWNANSSTQTVNNFQLTGGIWNAGSSTLTINGDWSAGGTFNYGTGTVVFAKNGEVSVNLPSTTEGTVTFNNLTISANTTVDTTDDFISANGTFTQNGKLRREAPTQYIINFDTWTFKDARNRNAVQLTKTAGNSLWNTYMTITSNLQPPTACGSSNFPTVPVLRTFDIVPTQLGGTYTTRLYFSASNPDESNGNSVVPPYTLAIYHCNSSTLQWEKINGTGGSDANGVYVQASVTMTPGSTYAVGSSGSMVYYSQGSLDAGALASWNTARNGSGSQPANFTGADYFVIQNGHSMTTASALTLSNADSLLQIENGGTLTLNTSNVSVMRAQIDSGGTLTVNSGRTLTINNGSSNPDLTVNGTLVNASVVTMNGTGSFGAGSTYQHAQNGGTIPTATWNSTSTVSVIGLSTTAPGGLGQAFGNFTFNSPSQTGNVSLAGSLYNVLGNLTVTSTGSGSVRLANTLASGTVNVGGNVLVNGGTLYVSGSTGAVTLNVGGNLTVSSGNFYFSGGTATPTVNVAGNVVLSGGLLKPSNSTGASTLNISGDWTHDGGTFTSSNSTVNFNGSSARSLGGSVPTTFNNVTLTDSAGLTMNANATVTGVLTFSSGNLDTGNNVLTLDCNASISGASASRYILGNLKKNYCATGSFTYPTGTGNGYSPVAATLTALGTNPSSLQIRAVQSTASGLTDSKALDRYWTLTETGDVTTNLTFTYLAGDVDGNESDYRIYRGTTEVCGVACVDEVNHTATISGVTQFSDWSMGEGGATPTNATLLSFNAKVKDSKALLNWETGNELNIIGFNSWRAAKRDGTYKKLNKQLINAKTPGELTGNSYSYRNKKAKAGKTYFFKLEVLYADGTSEWSDIRRVKLP